MTDPCSDFNKLSYLFTVAAGEGRITYDPSADPRFAGFDYVLELKELGDIIKFTDREESGGGQPLPPQFLVLEKPCQLVSQWGKTIPGCTDAEGGRVEGAVGCTFANLPPNGVLTEVPTSGKSKKVPRTSGVQLADAEVFLYEEKEKRWPPHGGGGGRCGRRCGCGCCCPRPPPPCPPCPRPPVVIREGLRFRCSLYVDEGSRVPPLDPSRRGTALQSVSLFIDGETTLTWTMPLDRLNNLDETFKAYSGDGGSESVWKCQVQTGNNPPTWQASDNTICGSVDSEQFPDPCGSGVVFSWSAIYQNGNLQKVSNSTKFTLPQQIEVTNKSTHDYIGGLIFTFSVGDDQGVCKGVYSSYFGGSIPPNTKTTFSLPAGFTLSPPSYPPNVQQDLVPFDMQKVTFSMLNGGAGPYVSTEVRLLNANNEAEDSWNIVITNPGT